MKQIVGSIAAALTLAVTIGMVRGVPSIAAQVNACLHGQDESAAQQARRRGALALTRQINSYEVVAKQRTQTYRPPASLPNLMATPAGFDVRGVASAFVGIPLNRYKTNPEQAEYFTQVIERLKVVPQIKGAAVNRRRKKTPSGCGI